MISTVDLFKEIKVMEEVVKTLQKAGKDEGAANLKAKILTLKLLHNLRTNTVLIMDKLGIEKVKTERPGNVPQDQAV